MEALRDGLMSARGLGTVFAIVLVVFILPEVGTLIESMLDLYTLLLTLDLGTSPWSVCRLTSPSSGTTTSAAVARLDCHAMKRCRVFAGNLAPWYHAALASACCHFFALTEALPQAQPDERPVLVTSLFVYPVKSCAGVSVAAASLTARGLAFDRQWMVVDG